MNLLVVLGIVSAISLMIMALDKWVLTEKDNGQVNSVEKPAYINLAYSWGPLVTLLFAILLLITYFDFSLVLTLATLISLVVVVIDFCLFRPKRKIAIKAYTDNVEQVDKQTLTDLKKAPVGIEFIRSLFPVLLVVFVVRSFLIEPFQIPSGSMEPTLKVGDFILVNKFAYGVRLPVLNKVIFSVNKPQRGDVMVFRYPMNPKLDYIKRVIGIPGDHIEYTKDKQLIINGKAVDEQFIGYEEGSLNENKLYKEKLGTVEHTIRKIDDVNNVPPVSAWVVPEGYYFMMGDNRDNSKDSRFWIADMLRTATSRAEYESMVQDNRLYMVPEENIVGKAFYVWMHWPSPKMGHLPSFTDDRSIQ